MKLRKKIVVFKRKGETLNPKLFYWVEMETEVEQAVGRSLPILSKLVHFEVLTSHFVSGAALPEKCLTYLCST